MSLPPSRGVCWHRFPTLIVLSPSDNSPLLHPRNRIRGGQGLVEVPPEICASLAAEAIMDGQEARLMASTMWLVPRARLGREVVG